MVGTPAYAAAQEHINDLRRQAHRERLARQAVAIERGEKSEPAGPTVRRRRRFAVPVSIKLGFLAPFAGDR